MWYIRVSPSQSIAGQKFYMQRQEHMINTVEPLLKIPLNKGHLCYEGHLPESQISTPDERTPHCKKLSQIGVHLIGAPLCSTVGLSTFTIVNTGLIILCHALSS